MTTDLDARAAGQLHRVTDRTSGCRPEGQLSRCFRFVAPQGLLLTSQEAADFLGVSRPTLVKLLEDGAIAFEKPNRHRRVRLQDLIDFQQRRRTERRAALNRLTEEAGELGLYEDTPADYATALKSARRRRAQHSTKA